MASPCHGRGLPAQQLVTEAWAWQAGTGGGGGGVAGRELGASRWIWLLWVIGKQPGGAEKRLQLLETGSPGG